MKTTIQDDRTPDQVKTHTVGIVARDKSMGGWGRAFQGYSCCAWACAPDVNPARVYNWVKSRKEMKSVVFVDLTTYRPPRNTEHFHIYVANSDHVAARY